MRDLTNKTDLRNDMEVEEFENQVSENVLVSISLVTYNHESFIRKCLHSIIMQKTNFKYEILLGEDCSSDETRKICIEFAQKHPDKIRLFLHSRNNVIYINGSPTGRFNFLHNMKKANGKYIALCEGDDYWTDPNKLQRQVDFLEKNKNYVACFHNAVQIEKGELDKPYLPWKENSDVSAEQIIKIGGGIFPTAGLMFRNVIKEFPPFFKKAKAGDRALSLLLLNHGRFYFHNDLMACYRIHRQGVYSRMLNKPEKLHYNIKSNIYLLKSFKKIANIELRKHIDEALANLYNEIVINALRSNSRLFVLKAYFLYLINFGFFRTPSLAKHLLKQVLLFLMGRHKSI